MKYTVLFLMSFLVVTANAAEKSHVGFDCVGSAVEVDPNMRDLKDGAPSHAFQLRRERGVLLDDKSLTNVSNLLGITTALAKGQSACGSAAVVNEALTQQILDEAGGATLAHFGITKIEPSHPVTAQSPAKGQRAQQ